jgi:hypothetical protein
MPTTEPTQPRLQSTTRTCSPLQTTGPEKSG